jgi:hypothetical protein
MPPQDHLWTGQKDRPAPLGQPFDDRSQVHPIAGTPPRSAHVPLQNAQVMPHGHSFALVFSLLPITNAQQINNKTRRLSKAGLQA